MAGLHILNRRYLANAVCFDAGHRPRKIGYFVPLATGSYRFDSTGSPHDYASEVHGTLHKRHLVQIWFPKLIKLFSSFWDGFWTSEFLEVDEPS